MHVDCFSFLQILVLYMQLFYFCAIYFIILGLNAIYGSGPHIYVWMWRTYVIKSLALQIGVL